MKINTNLPITTVIRCPDCPTLFDKETGQPQEDSLTTMISDLVWRVLSELEKDGEPASVTTESTTP